MARDRFEAARRYQALKARAIEYLGGECRICGYSTCFAALEPHHLDPLGKDFTISEAMTSWERIKPELDKCELLCCRCHREVHDGMHPGYLVYDDDREGGYYNEEYDEDGNEIEVEAPSA